jgi:hypothetical protein
MNDIIKEQNVKIILETNTTLLTGTSPKIVFQRPDKATGSWDATILGTTMWVDCENKEINQAGWWYVHAQVNLAGDINPHYGKRATFLVKDLYKL